MFTTLRTSFLSSLFLGALVFTGCGQQVAPGSASVLDRTTRALAIGSVLELNGSYDPGCIERQGQVWSVGLGDFQSLTNAPLSVVLNDAGCVLYVTSFRVGTQAVSQLYLPPVPVALGADFFAAGVPFRLDPQEPVAFYANLRIEPDTSFQGPFTVTALYSEDVQATSLQVGPTSSSQVSAQLAAAGVPAPGIKASFTDLGFQVDAQGVVQSVAGYATLTVESVAAQSFIVEVGQLGETPSYAEVDAAFLAGVQMPMSGPTGMIPAGAFGLAGQSLATPLVRNIILANEEAGTRSYQLIRITFAQ
jgi:hypothetical protein